MSAICGSTALRRVAILAIAPALLGAGQARAHALSVAHVDVRVRSGSAVEMEVDLSLRDLALSLPLDANGDDRITWGELRASEAALRALLAEGVRLSDANGPCALQPGRMGIRDYDDGAYASVQLHARCGAGRMRLDYSLFFGQDPQHRALATVREAGNVRTAILAREAHQVSLTGAPANPLLAFVGEGWKHILLGYDHLAFLLCLLLPAVLLRRGGHWQPIPTARAGLLQALGLATAFTLAHSITLSLAALGWVTPSARWVEVGIAASVLVAALNLAWPVMHRRLWLATFLFGLIHGFGFAGALLQLGLPTQARLLALLGFNLGVELGQLAVIALIVPWLLWARRRDWYPRWVLPLAGAVVAALAGVWLLQRLGTT